jgi:transketolase
VTRPRPRLRGRSRWSAKDGPSFLALTRQKVDAPDRSGALASAEGLRRGAYVLAEATGDVAQVVLMASGSEVALALAARDTLQAEGVPTRVVSFPSWRLFEEQDAAYRASVLGEGKVVRVAVEAGTTFGWERYTGAPGRAVGIDRFGASAPAEVLFDKFGITAEAVVERVQDLLDA